MGLDRLVHGVTPLSAPTELEFAHRSSTRPGGVDPPTFDQNAMESPELITGNSLRPFGFLDTAVIFGITSVSLGANPKRNAA